MGSVLTIRRFMTSNLPFHSERSQVDPESLKLSKMKMTPWPQKEDPSEKQNDARDRATVAPRPPTRPDTRVVALRVDRSRHRGRSP